jgi:hypothetical protein
MLLKSVTGTALTVLSLVVPVQPSEMRSQPTPLEHYLAVPSTRGNGGKGNFLKGILDLVKPCVLQHSGEESEE